MISTRRRGLCFLPYTNDFGSMFNNPGHCLVVRELKESEGDSIFGEAY